MRLAIGYLRHRLVRFRDREPEVIAGDHQASPLVRNGKRMINPKPASRAAGNARKPLFSGVTDTLRR